MQIDSDSPHYNQQRLYQELNWIFPIISPPEDYHDESVQIIDCIKKHIKCEMKSLLNLGCGAGHNDFGLKSSFQITGLDLSDDMLNLARQLNPEVTYIKGDFTQFSLDQKFDVVTILDAVDYITSHEDLEKLFQNAYHHLKPGGVLLVLPDEYKEVFRQNHVHSETRTKKSD